MKIRNVFLACSMALLGCSDDPVSPATGASGSLSFSYTGAGATSATTYSASGTVPSTVTTGGYGTSAWAAGGTDAATNETAIVGSIPRTSTTWDIAVVTINRMTAGSSTINSSCSASSCTDVAILYGSNPSGSSFTFVCVLTTGTVTISSISSTNATGTFSGSGTCTSAAGATSNYTVTNGSFNVGLTSAL